MLETDLQPLAVYNEHAAGAHGIGGRGAWGGLGGVEAGDREVEGVVERGAVGAGGGARGAPKGPLATRWFHLTLTTEGHLPPTPPPHHHPFVAR